jgi:type II secretory pathway component PulF
MSAFHYRARDQQGIEVHGFVEAGSATAAMNAVEELALFPLEVRQRREGSLLSRLRFGPAVRPSELTLFFVRLSTMLDAGVPIVQALHSLESQMGEGEFVRILGDVRSQIEGGTAVADAMRQHGKIFGEFAPSLVEAGEAAGCLPENLAHVAQLMESEQEVRERLNSAMRYPMIVVTVLGSAIWFLMAFVVPKFVSVFSMAQSVELPLATRILIAISDVVNQWWWLTALLIAPSIVGVRMAMQIPHVRLSWDRTKLQSPVIGPSQLKASMMHLTRNLAVMIRSGVSLVTAFELIDRVLANRHVAGTLSGVGLRIQQGESLTESFKKTRVLTPTVIQMMAVGEDAGRLEPMLMKVSTAYEKEVDAEIKRMTALIEPTLTVVLGLIVLGFALAIFMPMWDMIQVFKNQ